MSRPSSPPSSTPPPPPSPPLNPPSAAYGGSGRDPYLAQSRGLPLTERDRQEGYDVGLLNARPRGSNSHAPSSVDGSSPRLAAGAVGGAGAGAATDRTLGPGLSPSPSLRELTSEKPYLAPHTTKGAGEYGYGAAVGAGTDEAAAASAGAGAGAGVAGSKASGAAAGTGGPGTMAMGTKAEQGGSGSSLLDGSSGRKRSYGRPWYMRPLALVLLIATVIAIALAIGLGVGLSRRRINDTDSSQYEATGANYTSTRFKTTSKSRTTGTVIPSGSYTSSSPRETTITDTLRSSLMYTPSELVDTVTNKPIPAGQATVTAGTTLGTISPLGGERRRRGTYAAPTRLPTIRRGRS
ncbi:BZ3500_MvSof-1268-A1-R1_Chr12-2g03927 [Microbotryum saponariae]|uniref:BZ3500_MvSof-1268-A1-R1_Chr12-2g03927 protein n=1 Tax=Microbotryum saponariae TaxID=289078 RepID=A0A2X0L6Q2_9BASI|nr:BZ3500_MvSof-1268-A1-R1_Chr12-2g03927 [Microbotryum saponariae]